jgi:hypothetical protein
MKCGSILMVKAPPIASLALALLTAQVEAQPIGVHSDNPHYFLFHGKPTVLVTSAEHYGAVVNRSFDYNAYLDALKSYGLNYTRIYPGFLFEPVDKFHKGNTLGVKPQSLILPWARGNQPGYSQCGNRFDLDTWDTAFFDRLRDFVKQADVRGIVVEVCFFNAQYKDTWPISPLFHTNNVQGEGNCDFKDAQTLKHGDVVRSEEAYVRKITQELNGFDNVILEVCDEPFITGTPIALAGPWLDHFVSVIKTTESTLPKKHLIAQQVEGPVGGPCDLSAHPDVAVIVTQYVWEAGGEQMGGMRGLDEKYGLNKPIELNETFYYPGWYKGDKVGASRVEAWEFMVGGGAGFNHLNGQFTVADPRGDTPDNAQVLRALQSLKAFLEGFDFIKMRPDKGFVVSGVPSGAYCRAISEPGRQYALYLHHSTGGRGGAYTVTPCKYTEQLVVSLPNGSYRAEWVEPASGSVLRTETFEHAGGERKLMTPEHAVDVALGLRAKRQR